MASPEAVQPLNLESLTNSQTFAYNRISTSSKKIDKQMFLFGKPSADIIYIMCKIYDENIIRILTKNRRTSVYKYVKPT
jgi:hypothetical protein